MQRDRGQPSTGPDRYRRGLYTFFWRATPHPVLIVFDAPTRRPGLHPPDPVEHAAPGADAAQRRGVLRVRPGPGRTARSRKRRSERRRADSPGLPPLPGPRAEPDGDRARLQTLLDQERAEADAGADSRDGDSEARQAAWTTRGPRAPEPRRVHHARMIEGKGVTPCDPTQTAACSTQTRRHFFGRCGVGLGSMALAVAARRGPSAGRRRRGSAGCESAGAPARALPRAGQERDLPVHGRRAQPARAVRPQARAPGVSRPADPRVVHQGAAVRLHGHVHQGAAQAAGRRSASSPSTASRARGSRSCLPHLAEVVDDLAFVRSVATDVFNHAPAKLFANTGSHAVRPAEHGGVGHLRHRQRVAATCPGFVVLQSGPRGPRGGAVNWGSGFLPTTYQGVPLRSGGEPILNLRQPDGDRRRAASGGRSTRSAT